MTYTSEWAMENSDCTTDDLIREFDEVMLRLYIYGDVEPVQPCDMMERVYNKLTFEKKYPTRFASALIAHIIRCGNCYAVHQDHNGSK